MTSAGRNVARTRGDVLLELALRNDDRDRALPPAPSRRSAEPCSWRCSRVMQSRPGQAGRRRDCTPHSPEWARPARRRGDPSPGVTASLLERQIRASPFARPHRARIQERHILEQSGKNGSRTRSSALMTISGFPPTGIDREGRVRPASCERVRECRPFPAHGPAESCRESLRFTR